MAQVLAQAAAFAHELQFIEIEVETLNQLEQALTAGAKMVLLDNMPLSMLHEAVRINAGRAILEISGGVTLDGIRALAETGYRPPLPPRASRICRRHAGSARKRRGTRSTCCRRASIARRRCARAG